MRRDEHVLHGHGGEAAGSGSSTVTSSAAPLICRSASASTSTGSSTTRPRAALRRYAGGFMAERIGVDQVLRFRRQRADEGNEIDLRQRALRSDIACTASACPGPARGSRRMPITRMSNAMASHASRPPICRADDQQRLAAELVSRCVRSPTVPRQTPLPRCRAPREASERAPAQKPILEPTVEPC